MSFFPFNRTERNVDNVHTLGGVLSMTTKTVSVHIKSKNQTIKHLTFLWFLSICSIHYGS